MSDPDGLARRYEALLAERMKDRAPQLRALFDALDPAAPPPEAVRLWIESDLGDPALPLHVRAFTAQMTETRAGAIALGDLNAALEDLPPLLTPEEEDAFILWEEAADGGRVHALEQPTDDADLSGLLIPWLRGATAGLAARSGLEIVFAFHDHRETVLHPPRGGGPGDKGAGGGAGGGDGDGARRARGLLGRLFGKRG
ncbi:hypothetical protein ACQ5SO_19085 [Rhodovulum sp. DZ06]|uniref:hypothetical protein n=1 Tax=Rhodovulum sp. DZ06 TaxID=3425126 RepID=UPI003D344462